MSEKHCIFCAEPSSASRSVEHILPESLGNIEHVLPRGVVCDRCNNYFAVKIEEPLLGSQYFTQLRSRQLVPSKRGLIPPIKAFATPGVFAQLHADEGDGLSVSFRNDRDTEKFIDHVNRANGGTLLFPFVEEPDHPLLSRWIAKVAVEALAKRVTDPSLLISEKDLGPLRGFARYGFNANAKTWPLHVRRIYAEDFIFPDKVHGDHQLLHEFDFLYTRSEELYFVIAIFGVEFTINCGAPTLDGYFVWLKENGDRSPLYPRET